MSTAEIVEGDGLNENLFHLLWARDPTCDGVPLRLPHTVVFRYQQPSCWYFTSVDGSIKRKKKVHTTNQNIEAEFLRKPASCGIVATYMYNVTEETTRIVVEYFDEPKLREFLYSVSKNHNGVLQKFVQPRGCRNFMIRALWTPHVVHLERRVNKHSLTDKKVDIYDRAITFEGPPVHSELLPVRGNGLADDVYNCATSIMTHVRSVKGDRIRLAYMALNFTVDEDDKLWFLMASTVKLDNSDQRVSLRANIDELGIHNEMLKREENLQQRNDASPKKPEELQPLVYEKPVKRCPICDCSATDLSQVTLHSLIVTDIPDSLDTLPFVIRKLYPTLDAEEYWNNSKSSTFFSQTVPVCDGCVLRFTSFVATKERSHDELFGTKSLEPNRIRNRFASTRAKIEGKRKREEESTRRAYRKMCKPSLFRRELTITKPVLESEAASSSDCTKPVKLNDDLTIPPFYINIRFPRAKPEHWMENLREYENGATRDYVPTYARSLRTRPKKCLSSTKLPPVDFDISDTIAKFVSSVLS